jgi:2-dehydro-3-deoxy-D-arabinonate dehydratase
MKLYRTRTGPRLEDGDRSWPLDGEGWDALLAREDLPEHVQSLAGRQPASSKALPLSDKDILAPIEGQEVWAAGVTYFRSRDARMEEARSSGGGSFYDRVYTAERPELFFKASPHRVAGPGEPVRIRRDSKWNVPEPELALAVAAGGRIIGYTIGNDMSSRDIEGENPLYLPQAKVYDKSCALGPGILVTGEELPAGTRILLEVSRRGSTVFSGSTTLAAMKRRPAELVEYLFRDNSFPRGCFLLTGTGVVPPPSFTLEGGDEIRITVDGIGSLVNSVESRG